MKRSTVLIVDDESYIREFLAQILSEHFQIAFAKNGKEALELFKSKKIDIIITDIIMPEMTGIELYDEVVKIKKEMKFLFTSGYRSGLLSEEMLKKYPFIQKPYDFADIIKILEEISKEILVERSNNENNS